MFEQQFYLDCGYFDGLAGMMPRWQLYGMASLLNGSGWQDPSPDEIRELLSALAGEFSSGRAAVIVTKLYQQVVLLEAGKGRLKELGESCQIIASAASSPTAPTPAYAGLIEQIEAVSHNISIAYNIPAGYSFGKVFHCDPALLEGELSGEEQRRQRRRQAIALALSEHGFGHHSFIESQRRLGLRDLINRNKYTMLARSVVSDTFRRIELYVQESAEICALSKGELSLALEYLLRSKAMMAGEDSLAFLSAMKMAFQLPHSLPSQQAVVKVYLAVQCHVRKELERQAIKQQYGPSSASQQRAEEQKEKAVSDFVEPRIRYRIHRKGKRGKTENQRGLDKIWDDRMEEELIASFKRDCDYGSIRSHFQRVFPEYRPLLSINSLKKQLHKLIRVALRRLKGVLQQMGEDAPQMVLMTDKRTKYLMLVESNELVGKELIKLYSESFASEQLEKTVRAVNAYVSKKDAESQMRKKYELGEEEEAKMGSDPDEYSDVSANEHEEQFRRAKAVLSGVSYKSIETRSEGRDFKGELFTSDTWQGKICQNSNSAEE